jgi:DNA-binding NarL/FixJ family response regulator
MGGANATIRVLVADDHPVYVDGLTAAIANADDLDLVGTCGDGTAALAQIRANAPDVAVLDLRMPGMSAQALLQEESGECPVPILSVHFGGDDVHECLIASRLYLSAATVKTHLHHLYEKLGVSDRTATV